MSDSNNVLEVWLDGGLSPARPVGTLPMIGARSVSATNATGLAILALLRWIQTYPSTNTRSFRSQS